jgi:uncharacterized repeat protein (TIGR01451 family)
VVVLLASIGTAAASHLATDTEDHTTLEQILRGGDRSQGYATLAVEQVSDEYIVRDPMGIAQTGREQRRRSAAYFSQMTDFQLADEESPARVEFSDPGPSSAWRPWEALGPFMIEASVRQINRFVAASPVPQGDGTANSMDFSLMTGDQADNQQRNETVWVRELLEGGSSLNFNSGSTDPLTYVNPSSPSCAAFVAQEGGVQGAVDEASGYTGVQDFDDYDEGPNPYYYDPDDVRGSWAASGWPTYTGLLDRAQQLTITPSGIDVPFYVTNGNHDVLVQGNEDATQAIERIATGCEKALGSTQNPTPTGSPDPDPRGLMSPSGTMLVPPDERRQFVSKLQIKDIYGANNLDDDHGFGFVDPQENAASNGSASYYAWNPPQTPGMRFISIDTNSEGGVVEQSSHGNLDDPQFKWLERELDAATRAGKLIVIFGHHPVRSLISNAPDEAAPPCTVGDGHGHDINPGCDIDTRPSAPLHMGSTQPPGAGESFVSLLGRYPNVVSYVAGHTHENNVDPFTRPDGSVWWSIETSAVADWSQQSRLIEVMDNRDGTLSIFGTILDHASQSTAPEPGIASGFGADELASIARTFAYNDPQSGAPGGEGSPEDRNVELLVRDPRRTDLALAKSDTPDPVSINSTLTYTVRITNNGPSPASAVAVSDTLPAGATFLSATATQGVCSANGGTVSCQLGDLANGASATVTIRVRTPAKKTTLTNTATVSGAGADPVAANNTDTETTTVKSSR